MITGFQVLSLSKQVWLAHLIMSPLCNFTMYLRMYFIAVLLSYLMCYMWLIHTYTHTYVGGYSASCAAMSYPDIGAVVSLYSGYNLPGISCSRNG